MIVWYCNVQESLNEWRRAEFEIMCAEYNREQDTRRENELPELEPEWFDERACTDPYAPEPHTITVEPEVFDIAVALDLGARL